MTLTYFWHLLPMADSLFQGMAGNSLWFMVYCSEREADSAKSARVASQSSITGRTNLGTSFGEPDGQRCSKVTFCFFPWNLTVSWIDSCFFRFHPRSIKILVVSQRWCFPLSGWWSQDPFEWEPNFAAIFDHHQNVLEYVRALWVGKSTSEHDVVRSRFNMFD